MFKPFDIIHQDEFNRGYDHIYTIKYYFGFYSSLRDQFWANGDYFKFCKKVKFDDYFQNECGNILLKSSSKIKMAAICSIFSFQRAVKVWIIANCIDFITSIFKLVLVYDKNDLNTKNF